MSPIVYITLCYVAGIITQKFLNVPFAVFVVLSLIGLIACFLNITGKKNFWVAFLLLIFVLGAFSLAVRMPSEVKRSASISAGPLGMISKRLNGVCLRMLPHPYCDLLGSLVLGSSASPPPSDIKEAYRKVGLIHLLVASGQQISLLFGSVLAVTRMLNLSPRLAALFASVCGVVFSIIAGAGPSIVRAFIMSELTLIAPILGRDSDPLSSLSAGAFILLLFDPRMLFDIGFQLSFAATFALLFVAPLLEDGFLCALPKALKGVLAISIAPFLVTMPVIAYNFSQVSLVSVIANALVILWIELLVVIGFAALTLGSIFLPASLLFSGALFFLLKALNAIVFFFAALPFSSALIKQPTFPMILCYYIFIAGALVAMKNKASFKFDGQKALLLSLVISVLLVWHVALGSTPSLSGRLLTATFIDVGQGDAILIEAPSGKKVLIDGGEKYQGKYAVMPLLAKKGINKLDAVVLTHPHSDHVGGLLEVLKSVKVDLVIDSGQPHPSNLYVAFLKLVDEKKIKYKVARKGDKLDLSDGIVCCVLSPSTPLISSTQSDLNNNSVVLKVVYNKFSFLLAGDIGFAAEERLTGSGADLKSEVLKVGHHGSSTSSSSVFLKAVAPKLCVISVGAKNKHGHPGGKTVKRLGSVGAKIYRTDLCGTITITTNGSQYVVDALRN
jgi:competence protein ComEC